MRLILIRHGDPDYEHDTLTSKGRREAALLAERTKTWKADDGALNSAKIHLTGYWPSLLPPED